MHDNDGNRLGDDTNVTDRPALTIESPGRAETYMQIKSTEDVPGGLYASHGAVTANALATAAVGKDLRRRAYMRRMISVALIIGIGGSALVVALAWLLD